MLFPELLAGSAIDGFSGLRVLLGVLWNPFVENAIMFSIDDSICCVVSRMGRVCGSLSQFHQDFIVGQVEEIVNVGGQPFAEYGQEEILQMEIVGSTHRMIIDLRIHEVSRQKKSFGRFKSSRFDAEHRCGRFLVRLWQDSQCVDETVLVKLTVDNPCMKRVTKEIVHPIYAKAISDDDLC